MRATGADKAEVERVYLSAIDFADSPDEALNVVTRLESIQSYEAAMDLCRRISAADPLRREPYVLGMRLSEKTKRPTDAAWAIRGVLGQAWPEDYKSLVSDARRRAKALHGEMVDAGDITGADDFGRDLQAVTSHDVVIRVSWTGDADLDISVEEPSGTVCTSATPVTAGGGTFMGDVFPGSQDAGSNGVMSETYVCPQGFDGQYRLLIRRVWGNVAAGVASIEILTDTGRPTQRVIRKQIPITERDALVTFELKDGKRSEAVVEAQLAHLRDVERDLRREVVLGQTIGNAAADSAYDDPYATPVTPGRVGVPAIGGNPVAGNPFFRRGAVGFRPQVTQLPEGASMTALAVISADRRYVRVSPTPFFSQIADVTTFNFVEGEEGAGTGGGAAGGGGGLGGGLGGGGFGGGGGGVN